MTDSLIGRFATPKKKYESLIWSPLHPQKWVWSFFLHALFSHFFIWISWFRYFILTLNFLLHCIIRETFFLRKIKFLLIASIVFNFLLPNLDKSFVLWFFNPLESNHFDRTPPSPQKGGKLVFLREIKFLLIASIVFNFLLPNLDKSFVLWFFIPLESNHFDRTPPSPQKRGKTFFYVKLNFCL